MVAAVELTVVSTDMDCVSADSSVQADSGSANDRNTSLKVGKREQIQTLFQISTQGKFCSVVNLSKAYRKL